MWSFDGYVRCYNEDTPEGGKPVYIYQSKNVFNMCKNAFIIRPDIFDSIQYAYKKLNKETVINSIYVTLEEKLLKAIIAYYNNNFLVSEKYLNAVLEGINYYENDRDSSTITLYIPYQNIPINKTTTITGQVLGTNIPIKEISNITLFYELPEKKYLIRNTIITENGNFKDIIKPNIIGIWIVRAIWKGDADHFGSESPPSVFYVIIPFKSDEKITTEGSKNEKIIIEEIKKGNIMINIFILILITTILIAIIKIKKILKK